MHFPGYPTSCVLLPPECHGEELDSQGPSTGLFPFRDRAWSFRPQTSGHFAGLSACLADTTSPCFLGGPKPSQRNLSPAGAVLRRDLASSCLLLSLQVKVTVLADNDPSSSFHYLIQVYTGYRRRAATTAKVSRAHAYYCVSSAKCVFSILYLDNLLVSSKALKGITRFGIA